MVIGEFLILLDAGFVGYVMNRGIQTQLFLNIILFWSFLVGGVILRYIAEKYKRDEL